MFFLGKLESVAPLLASADLFLLPTKSESFGLSALEALACGVPVIGANAGGLPEVVRHGETGFLCEPGDVDGMARAAIALLGDERAGSAMSARRGRRARALRPRGGRRAVRGVLSTRASAAPSNPATIGFRAIVRL